MWHGKTVVLPFRWKKEIPLIDDRAGRARVNPRTKNLTKRLRAGEVVIIDHSDIDRVSAEALMACSPLVVVNMTKSMSGRRPNPGLGTPDATGVPLVNNHGPEVVEVGGGTRVCVMEISGVYAGEEPVAMGAVQTIETIAANQESTRAGMNVRLKAFVTNTMEYVKCEQDLIFDGVGMPDIKIPFEGRHVLVVVRGYRHKEDLTTSRPYIREYRPIMIGVDGGAGAMLEEGYKLDMVVGDMGSVSGKTLTCGAEIIVHTYWDGHASGNKHVDELRADHVAFPCTGTSGDVAMLLTDDRGAKPIVALSTHNTLIELLDEGCPGMASAFLTRFAVGGKLIDVKGVSQLHRSRISN